MRIRKHAARTSRCGKFESTEVVPKNIMPRSFLWIIREIKSKGTVHLIMQNISHGLLNKTPSNFRAPKKKLFTPL